MKKKKKENFLDFIPKKEPKISWEINDNDLIKLTIPRDSIFDKIAYKVFKASNKHVLDLDANGSFVWQCIDGQSTVYDISQKIHNKFGNDAEPVIERLVTYLNILKNNEFITFRNLKK